MTIRLIFAFLIIGFGAASHAADCYGHKEKLLAEKLLIRHPELSQKLKDEKNGVWFVRDRVCDRPYTQKSEDKDFLVPFFREQGWRPLVKESKKYHLSRERVLVAMDDIQREVEKKLPTPKEMHDHPAR
jgi:hypothetical protein